MSKRRLQDATFEPIGMTGFIVAKHHEYPRGVEGLLRTSYDLCSRDLLILIAWCVRMWLIAVGDAGSD